MEYLDNIIELIILFTAGLISPGPDFALIVKYSLTHSRKTGLIASLGIACGAAIHVTYILIGVGELILNSSFGMQILSLVGGAYLSYIGFLSIKTKKKSISTEEFKEANDIPPLKAFTAGMLTCLLNPKAIFFITSILISVIDPKEGKEGLFIYGTILFVETFLWFSFVTFFLTNSKIREKARSVEIWISRITGSILLVFGMKLILEVII